MDFMENIGFELKPYQIEIINAIKENIDKGNRMQSILLPNAGGKTTLSFILSIMFTRMGKKVMYFSNTDMDKNYACHAIRTSKESFEEVDFGNEKNIKKLIVNHYDIVITDAITGYFDANILSGFTNRIKSVNIPEIEEAGNNASIAQRQLVALHYNK